ncbi:MAG: Lon protease family protein [Gammaproteobacteria bacterium]
MSDALKLTAAQLRITFDLSAFTAPFETVPIVGQQRAQAALQFGIAMQNPGYNIYVMGEPGTGRLSLLSGTLQNLAQRQETPPTYAYVDNFDNPREPLAMQLPAGQGGRFCATIDTLIDNLLATFPAVFESPAYQQKKTAIERLFNQRYKNAIDTVEKKAHQHDIALYRDGETITFAPLRNGKCLDDAQFAQLPQPERDSFHHQAEELEDYLADRLLELPQWRREMAEKIRALNYETIETTITPLFDELRERHANIDDVVTYLEEIKKDLGKTVIELLAHGQPADAREAGAKRQALTERYMPNILIDYAQENGVPVVYEPHPIYQNLFGRIEYTNEQGVLITGYRRICAGALHRANGGYLILDAEKVLNYPWVWEALKRSLKAGRIEIEPSYAETAVNTISLKPEMIPLNVKVILVGGRDIYYLLQEMDAEFNEMFRILADFDTHITRTADTIKQFAALMLRHAVDIGAKTLTSGAVECLLEHSCRQAENQHRLSGRIGDALDIIAEAELLRSQCSAAEIDRLQITQALNAREYRNGRIAEEILDEMLDGTILIDTQGSAVGTVNGLTILDIGDSSFGSPCRITATVYPGSRGIVDIEREVELGQSIHSKGVMILTGYLGHCYAQQFPLAISASIAIEQSYGYIDGDSASLPELCALISALTRLPIRQHFAVTGSINQYGEVQAVGGINEKIEGFFRLCQARGLTGEHAAIIPKVNARHLMLKQEVIDAVAQGLFAVYGVSTVDQTLELLTGTSAGRLGADGQYPEDSVNHKVILRLKEISDLAQERHEDGDHEGS